jgi:hypothetical protein
MTAKASGSFLEKKNQKTFTSSAHAAGENRDSDPKVFCFFSSEKKALRSPSDPSSG